MTLPNYKKLNIAIIGGGLAGWLMAHRLLSQIKSADLSVTIYDAPGHFPPSTYLSTGVASTHGVEKGFNLLGDWQLRAYESMEFFLQTMGTFKGVTKGRQIDLFETDYHRLKPEYFNRFSLPHLVDDQITCSGVQLALKRICYWSEGEAYFFQPVQFLENLRAILILDRRFKLKNVPVLAVDQALKKVILQTGLGSEIYDQLVLCVGSHRSNLLIKSELSFPAETLVPGAVWEYSSPEILEIFSRDQFDFKTQNFRLHYAGYYLMYRAFDHKLFIGQARSFSGQFYLAHHAELAFAHQLFKQLLKNSLPDFQQGKMRLGVRSKGLKRMPFADAVNLEKTIFSIHGLYKNGWSYAFWATEELMTRYFSKYV